MNLDSITFFAPAAICVGCDRPITPNNDWKTAASGGYLHRACEVAAR